MLSRLTRKFYIRPTLEVARDLLGKYIVHKISDKELVGKIVEVEAYVGPQDKASHAYGGKITERNKAEYLIGGHIYIYLVYGMYWQLNISTAKSRQPECVLIRAVEPTTELEKQKIKNKKEKTQIKSFKTIISLGNGPGKLCKYLKLSNKHYGLNLVKSKEVWLEDRGEKLKSSQIAASKRIGIDYAGTYWANRKLRFYIKDNIFVSKI